MRIVLAPRQPNIFIFLIALSFFHSVVKADEFKLSLSTRDPGKLIQVKNCLDYQFCTFKKSEFNQQNQQQYYFNTWIDLPDEDTLSDALNQCSLDVEDYRLTVENLTTQKPVEITLDSDYHDFKSSFPGIYLSSIRKKKIEFIQQLLDLKLYQYALNQVLKDFHLPTSGFEITSTHRNMGDAAAVTHEERKLIEVSETDDSCELIRIVRHELEHALQFKTLAACHAQGKKHDFSDHTTRERSAYLNDEANLPVYCMGKKWLKHKEKFVLDIVMQEYR